MRGASAASKIFFFPFLSLLLFPIFFFLFFSERQTFRNTCPENYPGLHVILCYPVGRRLFFPFLSLVSFSNLPPCSILLCCYNHNKTKNPYGHTYIYIYIFCYACIFLLQAACLIGNSKAAKLYIKKNIHLSRYEVFCWCRPVMVLPAARLLCFRPTRGCGP
ncbi:EC1118_1C17_0276p [Saccharomyces cerevisiae EC1118]|uniref:EC1118_1C17_0276p n=1 Tax=Saccharomyces cerevisiae (strain Lalvin EC1118 / Prise de mousse) TaxID=643680 RepID=C8Z448_YEAS8|nr:EC1118_1C17_0276p [Saccharomyces cerevisiae EC1118]